jgi:hypothetical protein
MYYKYSKSNVTHILKTPATNTMISKSGQFTKYTCWAEGCVCVCVCVCGSYIEICSYQQSNHSHPAFISHPTDWDILICFMNTDNLFSI